MRLTFLLVRFLPYWAAPISVVVGELGFHFRRKGKKGQYTCFGLAAFLLVIAALWLVFRGDRNSDDWVRAIAGMPSLIGL